MMNTLIYRCGLTEDEKKQLCSWKYPDEYAIYNLPPYSQLTEKKTGFANPDNQQNFYSFYENDTLVGYINLIERNNKFSVGIAVNPQLCSKGYGQQILKTAVKIAEEKSIKPISLQVRSWNKRAINCYKKAGFEIDGDEYTLNTPLGEGKFYRMTYTRGQE